MQQNRVLMECEMDGTVSGDIPNSLPVFTFQIIYVEYLLMWRKHEQLAYKYSKIILSKNRRVMNVFQTDHTLTCSSSSFGDPDNVLG